MTPRRALWRFDRADDGGREVRERGRQVMRGPEGSRARFCTVKMASQGLVRFARGLGNARATLTRIAAIQFTRISKVVFDVELFPASKESQRRGFNSAS
jgi:hypothetical protein